MKERLEVRSMEFELSTSQKKILDCITDWYKAPKQRYLTLGGYAGTGKSTLLGHLNALLHREKAGVKIAYCTFTGKASVVLRRKLEETKSLKASDYIGTIHKLIYKPILDDEDNIIGWNLVDIDDFQYDLIIIDEASMVPKNIWEDLLSFQKPILAVGDHGQLPPIDSNFNLMAKPQLRLEEIYRQERENPIIKVSEIARKYGSIPALQFSNTVRKYKKDGEEVSDFLNEQFEEYSKDLMILTGYNSTRIKINKGIRQILNFDSPYPQQEDRVICLKNNYDSGVFNGMTGTILTISKESNGNFDYYDAEIEFDGEDSVSFVNMDINQFNSSQPSKVIGRSICLFDFGYAFTVHKAQGSQSEKVILFEERFPKMSDDEWRRWLYTGVTRAVSELYIIGR